MTTFYVFRKGDSLQIEPWERKERPMLECGHTANAIRSLEANDEDPLQLEAKDKFGSIRIHSCVICNCSISTTPPDLTGRQAKCVYCGSVKESSMSLPFFQVHPDREFDEFYDGCRGWD